MVGDTLSDCVVKERGDIEGRDKGVLKKIYMNNNKAILKNGVKTKAPTNTTELLFYDQMNKEGWTLTKRGFPTYFCFKEDTHEIMMVCVKPKSTHKLRREQLKMMKLLTSIYGVHCYVWTPEEGLILFEQYILREGD